MYFKSKLSAFAQYLFSVAILTLLPSMAMADDLLANKVKSAYLFHLINYIDWSVLPNDAFHVCVLGADNIGEMLQELTNRQVKNLPLTIETEDNNLSKCQLVFIGQRIDNWHDIIKKLQRSNVLTVSDIDKFASSGGMVGFYSAEGKTKLELNPSVIQAAQLKISAKLMELARIVPLR